MQQPETWRDVVGFEQFYEVSDCGRVRSKERPRQRRMTIAHGEMVPYHIMAIRGRVLRPRAKANGYLQVAMSVDGRSRFVYVHRLVVEAFIGPAPSARHQVGHLNGERGDNRLVNLGWVTPVQNAAHAKVHARPRKPTNDLKRQAARALLAAGFTDRQAARCLSLTVGGVRRALVA